MSLIDRLKDFGKVMVVVGGLAFLTGCGNDYDYLDYEGMIGEEKVHFASGYCNNSSSYDNILIVEKPDGTIIEYFDKVQHLEIEYIIITKSDGVTIEYKPGDPVSDPIMELAQREFDQYVLGIQEAKVREGLEALGRR